MPNKNSKTIEAYGLETEKLRSMDGSFSPFLMLTARLSAAIARNPDLRDTLGDDDPEKIALLQEYFYSLILIWDRHRTDRELDDSELNRARQVMER